MYFYLQVPHHVPIAGIHFGAAGDRRGQVPENLQAFAPPDPPFSRQNRPDHYSCHSVHVFCACSVYLWAQIIPDTGSRRVWLRLFSR